MKDAQQHDLGTGVFFRLSPRGEAGKCKSQFALDCAKRIRAYGALRADGDAKANSLSSIRLALIARLACADAIPDGSSNKKDEDEEEEEEEDLNQPPTASETKVGVLKPTDGNLRIASHIADAPMVARSILFPVDDENAPLERDGRGNRGARWLAALHAAELAQSLGTSSGESGQ